MNAADQEDAANGKANLEMLKLMKKGEGIVANKDFMLVFFITSFLPFVRPNLPKLNQGDIKKCKRHSKKYQALFFD